MLNLIYFSKETMAPTSLVQFERADDGSLMTGDFIQVDAVPCAFDELCRSWRVIEGCLVNVGNPPSAFHLWDVGSQIWKVDIDSAREIILSKLSRKRQVIEFSGFAFRGAVVQSDQQSQIRIQSLMALSQLDGYEVEWKVGDNSTITLSGVDFLALNIALTEHLQTCHVKIQEWKERIHLAESEQDFQGLLEEVSI